jgi:replication-associated recombination protein RarA
VESEIKNALGIKPKFKVDPMASATSHVQLQQEMQISKRLRPSTCNNIMFTKKIARHSSEKQNFFLTTVENESQIFELQQRRASNIE